MNFFPNPQLALLLLWIQFSAIVESKYKIKKWQFMLIMLKNS